MENLETKKTRFCKFCGEKIFEDAIICTACDRQVEELSSKDNNVNKDLQNIIINNNNNINNLNMIQARQKNKWISLLLLLFLGYIGGHKFYEERILAVVVYIILTFLTMGILTFFCCVVDFFIIIGKPNPYYI